MNFLFGLSRTAAEADGVWIIVDKLTKTTRFLPVKAQMYVDKIVSQYGVPMSIVSDRDSTFTSKLWVSL